MREIDFISAEIYVPEMANRFRQLDATQTEIERGNLLIEWMAGYQLPPISRDEPYRLVLESIPPDRKAAFEFLIASTLRTALLSPIFREPLLSFRVVKSFYNLCHLASGIGDPDLLNDPLMEYVNVPPHALLNSKYNGLQLWHSLRSALIYNQLSNELWPFWKRMLTMDSEPTEYSTLPGVAFDGFEGIRLMPESSLTRGKPAWAYLGEGVKLLAGSLDTLPSERRRHFKLAISSIMNTYPGMISEFDLVQEANSYGWPRWAVESLPSLVGQLTASAEGTDIDKYFMWEPVVQFLESVIELEVRKKMCFSAVMIVNAKKSEINNVWGIADAMDTARSLNLKPSNTAPLISARNALLDYTNPILTPDMRSSLDRAVGLI